MNRVAVTLVLLFVAGGLVYVSLSSDRARDPEPRDAAAPRAEVEPQRNEVALEPQVRLPVEPEKSLGSALAEYWGEKWPEMEARYAQAGIDLGASLAASGWKPWEEVEAEVLAAARSYDEHDREFNRNFFLSRHEEMDGSQAMLGITEDNKAERLPQLKAAVADIDAELGALFVEYMGQLDLAKERAFARGPERYPLLDLRGRDPDLLAQELAAGPSHTTQVEKGGWYVAYVVRLADCPELVEIEKQKQELVKRRLETLRSSAKELARAGR